MGHQFKQFSHENKIEQEPATPVQGQLEEANEDSEPIEGQDTAMLVVPQFATKIVPHMPIVDSKDTVVTPAARSYTSHQSLNNAIIQQDTVIMPVAHVSANTPPSANALINQDTVMLTVPEHAKNVAPPVAADTLEAQDTVMLITVNGSTKAALKAEAPPLDYQDTAMIVTVPKSRPMHAFFRRTLSKLPAPLRYPFVIVLNRVQDPQPEVFSNAYAARQRAAEMQTHAFGFAPQIALSAALGLLIVAYSYHVSMVGGTTVELFFLLGLLLMFVPTVIRLLSSSASRLERICLLYIVGVGFYLVQVENSPLHFSAFNEFLHWRTAEDIATSGHLFSENSQLPVSPYYPGLEIVTNALSTLSGLSIFHAAMIVLGFARLIMVLSLFILYEQITDSARIAGIATILYMTNPHFISFDVQFSYESLSLPLALCMLMLLARYEVLTKENRRYLAALIWLMLGSVVVTHHVTDFVFDALLLLWTITYSFQRARTRHKQLTFTALLGLSVALAYVFLVPGNPVVDYLSSYFSGSFAELGHVLTGTSAARKLFVNYSGQPTPIWDRLLTISSVAIIALGFPFGLLCLVQRYMRNGLACMFGIFVLSYPVSQAFRFTNFGSEIADRSEAFLFIPLAFLLAILITQFWPIRWLNWQQMALITSVITIIFLGGIILQAGSSLSSLPGPYLVGADNRSIETEGIEAAQWTPTNIGLNNRVATDRINRLLMSTYGDQHVVTSLQDKVDVSPVFFADTLGPDEVALLKSERIQYLVVDLRLSTAPPLEGVYFEDGEPDSYHHTSPLPLGSLKKFSGFQQINRVFDSGNIIIYDVKGFISAY